MKSLGRGASSLEVELLSVEDEGTEEFDGDGGGASAVVGFGLSVEGV